jgi:hypothetical protein
MWKMWWDWKFSWWCCWWFRCSGKWHCVLGGLYSLHLQGQTVQEGFCLTLKMKAVWAFEASGTSHPITHHHFTEDLNLLNRSGWIKWLSCKHCNFVIYCVEISIGLYIMSEWGSVAVTQRARWGGWGMLRV